MQTTWILCFNYYQFKTNVQTADVSHDFELFEHEADRQSVHTSPDGPVKC